MSITTTSTPTAAPTTTLTTTNELPALAVAPAPVSTSDTVPALAEGICGERLASVPADTEHSGWICTQPKGHLPGLDHSAEDGTTW
jgi:hypothetical protein